VCRTETPPLESPGDQHFAACHFWRELQLRAPVEQAIVLQPARQRLERLQSAFVDHPVPPSS
jgi:oligopeptide transport system ATP-binding protein